MKTLTLLQARVLVKSEAGVSDVVAVNVSDGRVILFVLDDAAEETPAEGMTG